MRGVINVSQTLHHVAQTALEDGVSYLYVIRDSRPFARIGLNPPMPFGNSVITQRQIHEFIDSKVPTLQQQRLNSLGLARFAFSLNNGARCRVDVVRSVKGPALTMHMVPGVVPTLESVHLSEAIANFLDMDNGLLLVCGKPRSGKSTTLASIIHEINLACGKHIVWISDTAEYVFDSAISFVTQVDLSGFDGQDARPAGIISVLGPDVVALDLPLTEPVIRQAVLTAQNGAQVILALQCASTTNGLEMLVSTISEASRQEFLGKLSEVFQGAVYQELLQGTESIVPVTEVLVGIQPVKNLLRSGRISQIADMIPAGTKHGMETLETSKQRFSRKGLI